MDSTLTPDQERECLAYDPFAGDFGSQGDKIFSDRMVTAAKDRPQGACCICFGCIAKGERHRVQKAVIDSELKQCRMCAACCLAMAQSWEDAGNAIELRTDLGMRRAGAMGREAQPNLTEAEFFAAKQQERVIGEHAAANARDVSADLERRANPAERTADNSAQTAANSARTAAASERMAAALDEMERMAAALDEIAGPPTPHISVKWLVTALAVLAAVGLLYRFITAQYGGG